MRTLLLALSLVAAAAVLIAALFAGSDRGAAPAEAASAPAVGAGVMPEMGAGEPDLVVTNIDSNQQLTSPCTTPAGALVTVQNIGTAPAGANTLHVFTSFSTDDVSVPALSAGGSAMIYANVGAPPSSTYTATVDNTDVVVESNEANNTLAVDGLTLQTRATCTPTSTPTPIAPTVTPTPTGFSGQDTDGDGILGSVDNCPFVFNPGQENTTDGNFIDHSPPYASSVDDKTNPLSDRIGDVCDPDWDNDTFENNIDFAAPCPTPTPGPGPTPGPCGPPPCDPSVKGTDPFLRDTDGDRALDAVECTLGTDPTSSSSAPTIEQCGPLGDADGDGLADRIEYCYYGTFPNSFDSDGDASIDGGSDGCEARSFNGDRIVNVADMGMLAVGVSGAVAYHPNVDVNKDGVLNPADQGMVAAFISPSGRCPDGMPDLVIYFIHFDLSTGSSCNFAGAQMGLRVWIRNSGNYPAGAFIVQVDGLDQLLSLGLGAGQTRNVFLTGLPHTNTEINHSVFVDSANTIIESNESNNFLSQFVPMPTLPPTCTPTPTPSPTVTPTPT